MVSELFQYSIICSRKLPECCEVWGFLDSGILILTTSSTLDEHRREIVEWLSAPNPFISHNAARKRRQQATGMWFLDSKVFTQWIRDDNR